MLLCNHHKHSQALPWRKQHCFCGGELAVTVGTRYRKLLVILILSLFQCVLCAVKVHLGVSYFWICTVIYLPESFVIVLLGSSEGIFRVDVAAVDGSLLLDYLVLEIVGIKGSEDIALLYLVSHLNIDSFNIVLEVCADLFKGAALNDAAYRNSVFDILF